jgi:hypothetical protein
VRQGRSLQAPAYVRGADEAATGRYLYLKDPGRELPAREFVVASEDDDALAAFDGTVRALLAARDAGAFFPRLLEPNLERSFAGCATCEVAQACLQPDSGARRRLARWVERMRAGERTGGAEAAAFAVWRLAEEKAP